MKHIISIICLGLLSISCNDTGKTHTKDLVANDAVEVHPGKQLMETNCYVCHSPTASHDDRIAPPMIAVKKHYLKDGMTKDAFINDIQNWIKNPSEDNVKMHGAVRRFGIMPKQTFPEETINLISDYMYSNDIEQPEWFEDHFNSEKGKHKGKGNGMHEGKGKGHRNNLDGKTTAKTYSNFADQGLDYALTTKAVLGKNLMGKLQKKGTLEALQFCNENAYPLTDSMAVVHSATIKRVSDQPRNQNNSATPYELNMINVFKSQLKEKTELKPLVREHKDNVEVYYPIVTNSMCLQCHGAPKNDIKASTMLAIAKLYPNDKAIGYDINQIRGIWKVKFEK